MSGTTLNMAESTVSKSDDQDLKAGLRVIQHYTPPTFYGNVIAGLAVSHYYVARSVRVKDLSLDLQVVKPLAVGVVDEEDNPVGIIVVSRFQDQMARPFAHDVFDKKPIADLMETTRIFSWDKNILTVAEKLDSEMQESRNRFYMIQNSQKKFAGIFSSRDMLIHLYGSIKKDLTLARTIQEAVVKASVSGCAGNLEYRGSSEMAKGVGGDWYDIKNLGNGRWMFGIADVSGKGPAASMVTTLLGGVLSIYDHTKGFLDLLVHLNNYILQTFHMEKYLTGIFAEYHEDSSHLDYYDMGHGYFYVFRQDRFWFSQPQNPFMGFVPDLVPKKMRIKLEPGDLVIFLTDGFPEQQNVRGEEYGIRRLEAFLRERSSMALADLEKLLHQDLRSWRGEQPKGDDMTLILIRAGGAENKQESHEVLTVEP